MLEAVARLEPRWEAELSRVEFAVQEVPDGDLPDGERDAVPLARLDPGPEDPPGIRRTARASSCTGARCWPGPIARTNWPSLVLDVVVEEFARLLGVDPETVDPGYDEPD